MYLALEDPGFQISHLGISAVLPKKENNTMLSQEASHCCYIRDRDLQWHEKSIQHKGHATDLTHGTVSRTPDLDQNPYSDPISITSWLSDLSIIP